MNPTVARLTFDSLLGRRRIIFLLLLPLVLILLAVTFRLLAGQDDQVAVGLLGGVALGALVPLLGLIAGNGSIGPEIDDGSIIYLLAKPLSRFSIVVTKLVVAIGTVLVFAALPTLAAGLVVAGAGDLAVGYAIGATVAGIAYCALFLLLSVVSRNAMVIGLLYVLLWEAVVGGYVPGAQALSVQQWSLAITEKLLGGQAKSLNIDAAVGLTTGVVLLVVVSVGATVYAGWRLRSIRLTAEE